MKPSLHPEFHRAMQASRLEEISRAAARRRAERDPERRAWAGSLGRAVAAGAAAGRLARTDRGGVNAYRPGANLPCPDDI